MAQIEAQKLKAANLEPTHLALALAKIVDVDFTELVPKGAQNLFLRLSPATTGCPSLIECHGIRGGSHHRHAKARMASNVAAISTGARALRRMKAYQVALFSAANSGVSATGTVAGKDIRTSFPAMFCNGRSISIAAA